MLWSQYVSVYRSLFFVSHQLTPCQMNPTTPPSGSESDCLVVLMSARSARATYLNQRDSSHRDVVVARERLNLHEARLQHLTAIVNAIEGFIGEARSRFRARGIPISVPQNVNLVTPPDPASQPDDTEVSFAVPSEHTQGSAGGPRGVTNGTGDEVRVILNYIRVYLF